MHTYHIGKYVAKSMHAYTLYMRKLDYVDEEKTKKTTKKLISSKCDTEIEYSRMNAMGSWHERD